jgi:hypothetical protein
MLACTETALRSCMSRSAMSTCSKEREAAKASGKSNHLNICNRTCIAQRYIYPSPSDSTATAVPSCMACNASPNRCFLICFNTHRLSLGPDLLCCLVGLVVECALPHGMQRKSQSVLPNPHSPSPAWPVSAVLPRRPRS